MVRCQAFNPDAGIVTRSVLSYPTASIRNFEKCFPTRLSFARVVRIPPPAPRHLVRVRRECWDRKESVNNNSGRLHWQREWRLSGTAEGVGPEGNEASDIVEEREDLARGDVTQTLPSLVGDFSQH